MLWLITVFWAKKIYRLKEDQAFSLLLELGRREKVARYPSADFLPLPQEELSPTCPPFCLGGGGKDFVDIIIATNALEMDERQLIL